MIPNGFDPCEYCKRHLARRPSGTLCPRCRTRLATWREENMGMDDLLAKVRAKREEAISGGKN